MAIPDSAVITELTTDGAKVEDYFIIGTDICTVTSRGNISSLLVEDLEDETEGEMHLAILAFLYKIGTKFYKNYDEYYQQLNKS